MAKYGKYAKINLLKKLNNFFLIFVNLNCKAIITNKMLRTNEYNYYEICSTAEQFEDLQNEYNKCVEKRDNALKGIKEFIMKRDYNKKFIKKINTVLFPNPEKLYWHNVPEYIFKLVYHYDKDRLMYCAEMSKEIKEYGKLWVNYTLHYNLCKNYNYNIKNEQEFLENKITKNNATIVKLPTKKIKQIEKCICCICLDTHKYKDIIKTSCNHIFGKKCFKPILKNEYKCPMCRNTKLSLTIFRAK
jgi:hypothetical protein